MQGKNLNAGHRQRLREEVIASPDTTSKEKVLELLLFAAIPMKDTRLLAKKMLEHVSGSFVALFNKDYDYLKSEMNLPNSIISVVLATKRAMTIYNTEEFIENKKIDSTKDMAKFFQREIGGKETEYLMVLFLNNGQKVVGKKIYGDKKTANVTLDAADIIASAQNVKAKYIIMSHNHPSSNVIPSQNDVTATNSFYEALKNINSFVFLDHIIVSTDKYYSFSAKNIMPNRKEIMHLFSDNINMKIADNTAVFKLDKMED